MEHCLGQPVAVPACLFFRRAIARLFLCSIRSRVLPKAARGAQWWRAAWKRKINLRRDGDELLLWPPHEQSERRLCVRALGSRDAASMARPS